MTYTGLILNEYDVKFVIQGIGSGHTLCWNSESEQMSELLKTMVVLSL